MRKLLGYFILTAATVASISLASCGKDDDDDSPNTSPVDTTGKTSADTTGNIPADTTGKTPVDTTTNNPADPGATAEYTLADVQGVWHVKKANGCEEYLEVKGEYTNICRYNTEYMGEDKWILLKLAGTNVTKNVLGFSPSYLASNYGYKLKSVSPTQMVATPKSQYFENEDYSMDDVTLTKVDALPERFSEPGFFQLSMDYTDW